MSAQAAPHAQPAFPRAARVVEQAIGEICTGAVLHIVRDGAVAFERAFGRLAPGANATGVDSVFDLASITKLFVGTALLVLHDDRRLALDDPIQRHVPQFAGQDRRRSQVTFRHLLTHTSGLPAHVNFRDELGTAAVIRRVCDTPLQAKPGTAVVYSDLGFMLAGEAITRLAGMPLDEALTTLVLAPLRLAACYRPAPELIPRIACTENDAWRRRLLRGEVHDENCWAMGGVGGHAGLFGTAADVATIAELYRQGGECNGRRLLLRPTASAAIRVQAQGEDERRGWAWAIKASDHHSSGSRLSTQSFGHTGYTGTSVWVDPSRSITIVLLTNRVFYTRKPEPIRALRAAVHDAVIEDLGS